MAQSYTDAATGPSTLVSRRYDAYGQLTSETTLLNGTSISAWTEAWNEAGRRTALNWTLDNKGTGAQYSFNYNALGLPTMAQNASETCYYAYGDNGLLVSRTNSFGNTSLARDARGRVEHAQAKGLHGELILSEYLTWRRDEKIQTYNVLDNTLGLPQETRAYDYDVRGRLTEEPYNLSSSAFPNMLATGPQTATYRFDENPLLNGNNNTQGLCLRTAQSVNDQVGYFISGENSLGQATSDLHLSDDGNHYAWNNEYDAVGEMISHSMNNQINQTLTWDSFGRLVNVTQLNDQQQGYQWKTIYDGLGRRIQTSYADATGNQTTSTPLTLSYYYDPEVEFLELGRDNFGRTWNLYGPDRSGSYGGAQGIGGIETTFAEGNKAVNGIINNFFGDEMATITDQGSYPWGNTLGGYGAMPGSSVNTDLVPQWRGHYLDWTGFYYMGARYYEPNSGRFLSADPLGHDASMSLYDYCSGDPVNGLDPDGRCSNGNATTQNPIEAALDPFSSYYENDLFGQGLNNATISNAPDYVGENRINRIGFNQVSDHNIPSNAIIFHAPNGQSFYAPPNADYQAVYSVGQSNGPFDILGIKNSVGINGTFDYQRNEGRGDISPALNIFYPAYTEASNYAVGVYMRGARFTLQEMNFIGAGYALSHEKNSSHAFSPEMKKWWLNGWNAANEGRLNGR